MKKFTIISIILITSVSVIHAQIDYRIYQSPVKNQVDRGTCTAFAIMAALETFPGFPVDLSEQYLYYQAKLKYYDKISEYTQGAALEFYIDVLQESGTLREDQAPYNPEAPLWDESESNFDKFKKDIQGRLYDYLQLHAFTYKLSPSSYTHLTGDDAKNIEYLKKRLDNGTRAIPIGYDINIALWSTHPASKTHKIDPKPFVQLYEESKPIGFQLAALKYGSDWYKEMSNGTLLAEYSDMNYKCDGGHAVAIVGYDEDGFLIKNSWGTELFGEEGYGWVSFDYHRIFASEALILFNGEIKVYDGIRPEEGGWQRQDFYLKTMPYDEKSILTGKQLKGLSVSIVYHGKVQMPRFTEVTYEAYDVNDQQIESLVCFGDVFDYRSNGFERIIQMKPSPSFPECSKVVVHFKTSKGLTFTNTYNNIETRNKEYESM